MGDLVEYLSQNDPAFRRARLPALYSDFRAQQSLNPDGYAANITAWQSALARLAWDGKFSPLQFSSAPAPTTPKRLVLDADDSLLGKLQSKQFGRPLALGTVLRDGMEKGELIPVWDFLSRKESVFSKQGSGGGWSGVPWTVASWAARQLGFGGQSTAGEDKVPAGSFVVLENLEKAAAALSDEITSRTTDTRFQRTFTKAHLERVLFSASKDDARPNLKGADVDVFLRFLERDKGLVAYDGKVARIRVADEHEEATITQEDVAVADLRELVENLKHQTEILGRKVDELAAETKAAVGRRNNAVAMSLLRQKKTAEATLKTRTDALTRMDEIAGKIQQARDQVQFVRVMEGSAGVLKDLNEEIGGVERVEGVVDDLKERMAETDEVAQILNSASEEAIDDDELDEELKALQKSENERAEREERAKKEVEEAKEAEDTRKRLEEAGVTPSEETPLAEAAEQLTRLSLEEKPQREGA